MQCNVVDYVFGTFDKCVLFRLMQLFSANSPLGNFHYSHGLELAVERGYISSISEFFCWLRELMNSQLYLDLPVMQRFYSCIQSEAKDCFLYYLRMLLSFRDTCELRMEEEERGEIIVKFISELGLFLSNSWYTLLRKSMLASITWIGYMWEIPIKILCMGYVYSSLESNIMAGLKLIPFGQFTAQKLLINLSDFLLVILERSFLITDMELGSSFPFQGIVSSCHEMQSSRLFRS